MNHWPRVKDLFHSALERDPAERAAFLHASCQDEAVRTEVERLLAAHERAGAFIEQSPSAMLGRVVGHYRIERAIGVGGMGEVYLARDLELDRNVAIKIALGGDPDGEARLRREAQHASQLNHPHICTIHEVGTFDAQSFIVMEFVDGRRLTDLIPKGGLSAREVKRYGTQIADALAHAHRNGVTHRDLKTSNVVVTPDRRAKVLDFGLARRLSADKLRGLSESRQSITADDMVAGTLACMAPELLRGGIADTRSDIWALGILLYEMASGTRPFVGATGFELSGAILHAPPAPLPDAVPDAIRIVIQRCLEKDPAARYQHADEIRSALEQAAAAASGKAAQAVPATAVARSLLSRCWRHRIAWAIAIALAFGSYRVMPRHDSPVAVGELGRPAIAVLRFVNSAGPDAEWLAQGVPSMLLTGLAQTSGLDIVSTQRLLETAKQQGLHDLASLEQSRAAEVAKRAGAGAIVIGSIYRAGAEIRIDARVEDLATGRVLAADTEQGTDVFAIVDRLTASIRKSVGIAETIAIRSVADVSTPSLEAYRAFAEGLEARNNFRFEDAQTFLDRAVAIDPRFAEAHLQLAFVAQGLGRQDRRIEHLRKATEHRARLSERERLLLQIEFARASGNFSEAARALDDLLAKFPDVDAAYDIAVQLYHPVVGALPSVEKSLAIGKAGVAALPLSPVVRQSYAFALFSAGRNIDALREFEAYARIAPRETEPHTGMALTYQVMGLPEKALQAYQEALKIQPDLASARNGRAVAFALMGRYDEALTEKGAFVILRARMLSRVGRYREAAQVLEDAGKGGAGSDPAYQAVHVAGALDAVERKDYVRALRECEKAREAGEHELTVETVSGVVEARRGRVDQAQKYLEAVRQLHRPTNVVDNYLYRTLEGEIALAQGTLEKAATAFSSAEPATRAFQFGLGNRNNPPFRDGLARVALARGDRRGAIDIYRRLLAQGPDQKFLSLFEPRYVLEIARLLDQLGDKPGALREYERFLSLWKNADLDLPELAEARRAVTRLRG